MCDPPAEASKHTPARPSLPRKPTPQPLSYARATPPPIDELFSSSTEIFCETVLPELFVTVVVVLLLNAVVLPGSTVSASRV